MNPLSITHTSQADANSHSTASMGLLIHMLTPHTRGVVLTAGPTEGIEPSAAVVSAHSRQVVRNPTADPRSVLGGGGGNLTLSRWLNPKVKKHWNFGVGV